jgi:hypothetical protein
MSRLAYRGLESKFASHILSYLPAVADVFSRYKALAVNFACILRAILVPYGGADRFFGLYSGKRMTHVLVRMRDSPDIREDQRTWRTG